MNRYILIVIVLLSAGCTIKPEEYRSAEEVCKVNGGVEKILYAFADVTATCNNGAIFQIR